MRIIVMAFWLVAFSVPLHAQTAQTQTQTKPQTESSSQEHRQKGADKQEMRRKIEDDYKETLKTLPNQKLPDPWGKLR